MEYATTETQAPTDAGAPPHSREAEESVIGSVLIDASVFHECRVHISSAGEFYIHRHRWIWQAFENLIARKEPVDLLTVTDELDNMLVIHEVGGAAYLTALVTHVPTSLNASAYAAIVHTHYTRRQMINAANEIAVAAYDENMKLEESISKATRSLSQAVATSASPRVHHISDVLKVVDAKIEERGKLGVMPGLPTGLIDLDRQLGGGAQDSDLLLIAGRPGDGKTSLLLQIMLHAAKHVVNQKIIRKHVVIFSLEMPEEQLVIRLLAQMSGIDSQALRSGRIPENKYPDFINALDELAQMDIVIDDTPAVSPAYIRSRCEILDSEQSLDAVFVDSLNLMRSGLKFQRTDQEVDYNATELKNLGRELNIPVWAAHQMNRGIEYRGNNSKPKLADLREGGEQPCDVVMFIWHDMDEYDRIKSSELIIDKHRNGPTGNVPVVFLGEQTKFENAFRVRNSN